MAHDRGDDRSDPLAWAEPGARVAYVDDARPDVVEERTVTRVTRSLVVTDDGARWRRRSLQRSGSWTGALRVLSGIHGRSLAPLDHPEVARRRTPPPAVGIRSAASVVTRPAERIPTASEEVVGTRTRRVAWTGTDDPHRLDAAVIELSGDRLRATGTSRTDEYAVSWTLLTGPDWITRRLEVAVRGFTPASSGGDDRDDGAPWSRDLVLERADDGRWRCDARAAGALDAPPPGLPEPAELGDALDCDLGLCPATNTMPALRLGLLDHDVAPTELVMAWVEVPSLRVVADRQTYASAVVEGRRVTRYVSARCSTDLVLDAEGVVLDYPGLARSVDGLA